MNEMEYEYRPAKVISKVLVVSMLIFGVAMFVGEGGFTMDAWLEVRVKDGMVDHMAWSLLSALLMVLGGVGVILSFLLSAVMFGVWIYRANGNARALGAEGMTMGPGWSAGCNFVPIVWFWKPYVAVQEIWRASSPDADVLDGYGWMAGGASGLVKWWWAAWLIHNFFVSRITGRFQDIDKSIEGQFGGAMAEWMVDTAFVVPLCVLAVMVVLGIEKRQMEKAEMLRGELEEVEAFEVEAVDEAEVR